MGCSKTETQGRTQVSWLCLFFFKTAFFLLGSFLFFLLTFLLFCLVTFIHKADFQATCKKKKSSAVHFSLPIKYQTSCFHSLVHNDTSYPNPVLYICISPVSFLACDKQPSLKHAPEGIPSNLHLPPIPIYCYNFLR